MLSKAKIKFIRSLQLKKSREKYASVLAEGSKIVGELINERPNLVAGIYASNDWIASNQQLLKDPDCEVVAIDGREMKQISALQTPQEVLAVVHRRPELPPADAVASGHCLYLDGIRDPGNMGTILRIADWFGYENVFLSADCADVYNPKVVQASMGSVFRIRMATSSLADVVGENVVPVYLSELSGTPLKEVIPAENGIIVLGNESSGVRSGHVDNLKGIKITIPGNFRLGADSLNVAVAAGIICAHFRMYAR